MCWKPQDSFHRNLQLIVEGRVHLLGRETQVGCFSKVMFNDLYTYPSLGPITNCTDDGPSSEEMKRCTVVQPGSIRCKQLGNGVRRVCIGGYPSPRPQEPPQRSPDRHTGNVRPADTAKR